MDLFGKVTTFERRRPTHIDSVLNGVARKHEEFQYSCQGRDLLSVQACEGFEKRERIYTLLPQVFSIILVNRGTRNLLNRNE